MNTYPQVPCICTTCPGSDCTCGCQQAAAQTGCACGSQCPCGQSCSCAKS